MTGWGSGPWGSTPWGHGRPISALTPSVITPLDPLNGAANVPQRKPIAISFTDELGVELGSITIAVNGVYYVIGGVGVNGGDFAYAANSENGYDIVLAVPSPFPLGLTQEVFVTCLDSSGFLTTLTYSFSVGVGLRLIRIHNPKEGMLIVHFNNPTRKNEEFFFTGNWRVRPLDETNRSITIEAVNGNSRSPHAAHLRYTGGDSAEYELRVVTIVDKDGNPIEAGWDVINFTLDFNEEEAPTVRLFNSAWGPIGISQSLKSRRTMDDLTADRAVALALDEQFALIRRSFDDTIGRNGRPGKDRY